MDFASPSATPSAARRRAGVRRAICSETEFRNYKADANPVVTEFYPEEPCLPDIPRLRVMQKKAQYGSLVRGKKSIWEAADFLNTLVDDSDPDTDLSQIEHLMQTVGGDPPGWASPLVCSDWLHSRSWARCCACGESRSGRWWETRSQ